MLDDPGMNKSLLCDVPQIVFSSCLLLIKQLPDLSAFIVVLPIAFITQKIPWVVAKYTMLLVVRCKLVDFLHVDALKFWLQ